jgi:hypothetical protein
MKHEYKPVSNGRASICTWELEFHFRKEEQVKKFVKLLMKDEIMFDFECWTDYTDTCTLYYVNVSGSWANNLVTVAKIAKKVDYKG